MPFIKSWKTKISRMKKIILLTTYLFLTTFLFGQITVSGSITDDKTGEALPFVAVSIKDASIGVNSDYNGLYLLKIPIGYNESYIVFSCVGYESQKVHIRSLKNGNILNIKLNPTVNELNEVSISAKSLFPYTVIKHTIENIAQNYYIGELNYKLTSLFSDNTTNQRMNGEVLLYDHNGYVKQDIYSTLQSINYTIKKLKMNYSPLSLNDEILNIDDLLEFDIVKKMNLILEEKNLPDYNISVNQKMKYGNDSVWDISYELIKRNSESYYDWHMQSLKGEMYISVSNYAILKNCVSISTQSANEISKNIAVPDTTKSQYTYTVKTEYSNINGKYFLKSIHYTSPFEKKTNSIIVDSVYTDKVQRIAEREYVFTSK